MKDTHRKVSLAVVALLLGAMIVISGVPLMERDGKTTSDGNGNHVVTHVIGEEILVPFNSTADQILSVDSGQNDIVISDVNNDSKNDLIVSHAVGNKYAYIFYQTNTLIFNETPDEKVPIGNNHHGLIVDDFNNDTLNDIISINYDSSNATLYYQNDTGFPSSADVLMSTEGDKPHFGDSGDLNDDGLMDASIDIGYQTGVVGIYYQYEDGFPTSTNETLSSGYKVNHVEIADYNNDGRDDVLSSGQNGFNIYYQNTSGFNSTPDDQFTLSSSKVYRTGAAYYNDDSYLDLAVISGGNQSLMIFYGTSNGYNSTPDQEILRDNPGGMDVGDFNKDGEPDIVLYDHDTDNIEFYYSTINGIPSAPDFIIDFDGNVGTFSLEVGDLNSDGLDDFTICDRDQNKLYIFYQKGRSLSLNTSALDYYPGEYVYINGSFWGNQKNVTFQIVDANDTTIVFETIESTNSSYNQTATLTFRLPDDAALGPWTVYAFVEDYNLSANCTFDVIELPLQELRIVSISVPGNVSAGSTLTVGVNVSSTYLVNKSFWLTLQVWDPVETPEPTYLNHTYILGSEARMYYPSVAIPDDAEKGTWRLQVNLLWNLPNGEPPGGSISPAASGQFEVV